MISGLTRSAQGTSSSLILAMVKSVKVGDVFYGFK
jgi:hypothetical protein